MKKNLFLSFIFLYKLINAQVGVGTQTPQKTLHVNGSLQITNELNVGGDSLNEGNAGNEGQVLLSNGPNISPSWNDLASSGLSVVAGLYGFLASGNNTTYLGSNLGANIRQIKWDNIKTNSKYVTYNNDDYSFTVNATGYYTFSINLVVKGAYTGTARIGLSKPYTGTLTSADNSTFSFLNQPYINVDGSLPITLYSNGTIFLNEGEKVTTLTRYITPTSNTLDVESINYNRTLVNSLSITFFASN